MSRSAKIELKWGDGRGKGKDQAHIFRLDIGKLEELQDICNAGPQRIFARLSTGEWRVQDIRETIRLGLIGGGMDPATALGLIDLYCADGMLIQNIVPARAIIMAAMHTDEDDPLPKAPGAEETSSPNSTNDASSTSPPSTASAPPSDSPQQT